MEVAIAHLIWLTRVGLVQVIASLAPRAETFMAADCDDLRLLLVGHADAAFVLIDDAILCDDEEKHFSLVRKLAPNAAIGVLVDAPDRERVLKAIYYGAVAVIETSAEEPVLSAGLRLFLDGQVTFPRDILAAGPPRSPTPMPTIEERSLDEDILTPREREVIGHIGAGKTVARIAAELNLSPHTVRVHVTRIMKKLDLRDRSSLIHYAVKLGDGDGRRVPLSYS